MSSNKLYNAMGKIDDGIIKETFEYKAAKVKNYKLRTVIEAAACVMIVCGFIVLSLVLRNLTGPSTPGASSDTVDEQTTYETDQMIITTALTDGTETEEQTTTSETTESETTASETTTSETTSAETAPETTEPETTVHETTVPETTAPETTSPETTAADTEKPEPSVYTAPAPEDKNGYKLFVNHIDVTNFTYFGVHSDENTILPLSVIISFLEHGSSEVKGTDTVILKYGDDEFTLKVKERVMTGNNYSENWFDNKQTKTTALYVAEGTLYADIETVNEFLSEFVNAEVIIDRSEKTVTAKDPYYDEDTRHIPVLASDPAGFNKNGYKLYINGNNATQTVNFDVSGDGEVTIPFAAVLNGLKRCETKDFGSSVSIKYDGVTYSFNTAKYELTGSSFNGNWFDGKETLFMAFYVKDRAVYTDMNLLNEFLSDFAGGSATVDHKNKIIEIKDKYYDEESPKQTLITKEKHVIPFSDGAFFTVTYGDENEKNPGYTRIDFYVPAKDDGDTPVIANWVNVPDGARVRITARRKTNNAIEVFYWSEYSGESDGGEYSYYAAASRFELYYTMVKPDAAFPYLYTAAGKSVSFTYTDGNKDNKMMINQKNYVPVEALASSLNDAVAEPEQTTDKSVDPVILYESDGVTGSFLQPYDINDPFTLDAGQSMFFGG